MDTNNLVGTIICEETRANVEFTVKEVNKNGFIIAEGILQEGDELNRNRRYYPTDELEKGINSPRTKELVETGNFKGEAGHPSDATLARQSKIDPTLEQVWYTKLWMDGNFVKAHFRGTNNDLGRSFNDDLRDGQKPSFSLRAVGSLANENGRMTVKGMQIITYDRVYFPSHSKAYTTSIVTTESVGQYGDMKYYKINPTSELFRRNDEINNIAKYGNLAESTEILVPLTQSQINSFLISESANIKTVLETFDCLYNGINLNEDGRTVSMKLKNGDKIVLSLEEAIQNEILNGVSDYF